MLIFSVEGARHKFRTFRPILQTASQVLQCHRFRMAGDRKPLVFFVLGAPGAGKGTQCTNIVNHFKFVHLSAGDLLRAERNTPGSPYGSLIDEHIKNGTIVPVEITCSLIDRAMKSRSENVFLVDGFPRNKDNLDGWQREMSDKVNVLGVLFFDCLQEVCMKRCLDRGAAGSGRTDDNEESLRKRFITYQNDTMPIIKHYESSNLVYCIDANRSPEEIFEDVKTTVNKVLPSVGDQ